MSFYNTYDSPGTPFVGEVRGGMKRGRTLYLKGYMTGDNVSVNLCTNANGFDDDECDFGLHFNMRANEGDVVLNTRIGGEWGDEERMGTCPVQPGDFFEMFVLAEEDRYRIAVNGQHFCEFSHRLPSDYASHVLITGAIEIQQVRYHGGIPAPSGYGYRPHTDYWQTPTPYRNVSTPFVYPLEGGMTPGRVIFMKGRMTGEHFEINLQTERWIDPMPDVAFHFNVRLEEQSVVRNSYIGGDWGEEERDIPYYPIQYGEPFSLIIFADDNSFRVAFNDSHFIEFEHRMPPYAINTLVVNHQVQIEEIFVQ